MEQRPHIQGLISCTQSNSLSVEMHTWNYEFIKPENNGKYIFIFLFLIVIIVRALKRTWIQAYFVGFWHFVTWGHNSHHFYSRVVYEV